MADKRFPSSKEVELFHTNSDKDGSPSSIHHTLGNGPNQAAPGDHVHDGGSSKELDIESWSPVSFENGWVDYSPASGAGFAPCKYAQHSGFIYLQGLAHHATSTTIGNIFTLPLGYRPKAGNHIYMVASANQFARIDVQTDGAVRIVSYNGGSAVWVSLSAIPPIPIN